MLKIRRHVSVSLNYQAKYKAQYCYSASAYTVGSHIVYKIILILNIMFYSVSRCILYIYI